MELARQLPGGFQVGERACGRVGGFARLLFAKSRNVFRAALAEMSPISKPPVRPVRLDLLDEINYVLGYGYITVDHVIRTLQIAPFARPCRAKRRQRPGRNHCDRRLRYGNAGYQASLAAAAYRHRRESIINDSLDPSVRSEQSREIPSPEAALLVACARLEMLDKDRASVDSAIAAHPDWNLFVTAARYHGIIALVNNHISAEFSKKIPVEVLETLRQEADAQARNNVRLAAELVTLLRLFADNSIAVIPLKGPVLARSIYGSVTLRRMEDLDFLFRESDLPRVFELMHLRGYEKLQTSVPALDEIDRRNHHSLLPLVCKKRRQLLEIHHLLLDPIGRKRFGLEELIGRTHSETFLGIPVTTLMAEDLLVYLCEHGTDHNWNRLEWVCGIAELLRTGRVRDWHRVIEFANRFDGHSRLLSGLLVARNLLGAPVPDHLLSMNPSTQKAVWSVVDRFMTRPMYSPTSSEMFSYGLATDQGLLSRLHRCWRTLAIPHHSDVMALALPRAFWPAYYLLRPLRLVVRQLKQVSQS